MMFSMNHTSVMSKLWIVYCIFNVFAATLFFLFICSATPKSPPLESLLPTIGLAALAGIILGGYITYRAQFTSMYAFFILVYSFLTFEILLSGSGAAFAIEVAGRSDLRWFVFSINTASLLLTLLICAILEARLIGVWTENGSWRCEIEKFIDYSNRQVRPSLTDTYKPRVTFPHSSLIIAAGSANIPLLFQIYGGGRVNAIFLAVPIITITLAYMNFKIFAPALVRLLLLRKIEKEVGYRFQNADYEKIQELRRGFVLARWLMKDYRPTHTQAAAGASGIQKENSEKKKKRKRGK